MFESIEEFENMSHGIKALVELDPLIGKLQWPQRRFVSQYMRLWWKNPTQDLIVPPEAIREEEQEDF
jgi:hypothetical protein